MIGGACLLGTVLKGEAGEEGPCSILSVCRSSSSSNKKQNNDNNNVHCHLRKRKFFSLELAKPFVCLFTFQQATQSEGKERHREKIN